MHRQDGVTPIVTGEPVTAVRSAGWRQMPSAWARTS